MKTTDKNYLAKEGYVILAISFVCGLVLMQINFFAAFLALVWLGFCVYFFRNPKREIAQDAGAIVSPADGVVLSVGEVEEQHFLHQNMTRVSIFMSPFNVHVNRAPENGTVMATQHYNGQFLTAFHEKAGEQNERHAVWLKLADGRSLVFVQVAGWFARRIVNYTRQGDQLNRGEIVGVIKFGSRVDVYLPKGSEVKVALKQKVKAGETIIA